MAVHCCPDSTLLQNTCAVLDRQAELMHLSLWVGTDYLESLVKIMLDMIALNVAQSSSEVAC